MYLCPICKRCGDGRNVIETVQCEKCNSWYYENCVPPFDDNKTWLGPLCFTV